MGPGARRAGNLIALRCFFQRVDVKALSACYLPKSVSGSRKLRPKVPTGRSPVAQDPSLKGKGGSI